LYETHLSSPAMAKFLETIPAYTTTDLDLNHYRSVGGFLDRDGTKKECERMLDQRIGCKSPEEREAVLKNLQELASEVQSTEKSKPSGVLTFLVFACLDNDTSARIYSRFESKADMEKFLRRSDVASFWQKSKDNIASMESKQYVPNGKGWLHRNGDILETGKPI
jgi:quinol monooxygenase YgiN